MRLAPGTIIDDRYEVLSCLGEGGMSVVYQAKQLELGRIVAIKVLASKVAATEESRLQREALALSSLKNRAIVSFYTFGFWNGCSYMVMEYVEGRSLHSVLSDGPLSVERSLSIATQVCHALMAAHSKGIIHRDLKPSNIMLIEQEGKELVKIIDFGLVCLLPGFGRDQQKLTEAGVAVGSALYMSPEQCIGGIVDHRADLYSLGAVLHQCLTGRPPFVCENLVSLMYAHVNEAPPALEQVLPDKPWPAGLQALLYQSLAKAPNARFSSAEEMLADLIKVEEGSTLQSRAQFSIAAPKSRRENVLLPLLGLAAVLTAAMAVLWLAKPKSTPTASHALSAVESARDLYTKARDLTFDFTKHTEQLRLLEQALVANERDGTLVGYSLADAEFLLLSDYFQLNRRVESQELGFRLLNNPWFDNLPDGDKENVYDLLAQSYGYGPNFGTEPESPDYQRRKQVLYDRIRKELTRREQGGARDQDPTNLLLPLARLTDNVADLDKLTAELDKNFDNSVGKATCLIGLGTCYGRHPSQACKNHGRVLCHAAENMMASLGVVHSRVFGALESAYYHMGFYADAYRCSMNACRDLSDQPNGYCHALLFASMSLSELGRYNEAKAMLVKIKKVFPALDPSAAAGVRQILREYQDHLRERHRVDDALQLGEMFELQSK